MQERDGAERARRRVFVVEDEAVVALALETMLDAWGLQCCGKVARAADALREIRAAQPDLVLMDVDLGPGMSGVDIARELRPTIDASFLFLTGGSLSEVEALATGIGRFACLAKPYTAIDLRAAVESALDGDGVASLSA